MPQILVVEDDALLNKTLCFNLTSTGYQTDAALSAASARAFYQKQAYDLTILDINLPDGNGFDLCRDLRATHPNAAVIFLTANDLERDMLKGFELGADDYVTKPFPVRVFLKKVAALLKRMPDPLNRDVYDDGDLRVDFSGLEAMLAGRPVVFTPMEYRTLRIFTQNPRMILTRQVLLEKLWDTDGNFVDEHALTTHISRLRNKVEKSGVYYIKTVYGMGYMWMGGANDES